MNPLSAIVSFFAGPLVDKLIAPLTHIFDGYINKQITEAQLREQVQALLIGAFKDIEIEHSADLAKTYATFWGAADTDKTNLMKIMWAAALGSQIFVLFWAQWCAPVLYAYGFMDRGWHAGSTVEWAYLLIGSLLGLGPLVLRSGPSAGGGIVGSLKTLIGK